MCLFDISQQKQIENVAASGAIQDLSMSGDGYSVCAAIGGEVLFYDIRQFGPVMNKIKSSDNSEILRCDFQYSKTSKRSTLSKSGEDPISNSIPIPSRGATQSQEIPIFSVSPASFEDRPGQPKSFEDRSPLFVDDSIKNLSLSTKISTVKEDLQQKIQDVHVDLLRQFHVQQVSCFIIEGIIF